MNFLNKILNRTFPKDDKFYTGEADPIPDSDGPVAGVQVVATRSGITLKHQFKGEGSDQTPIINPTKKVKEWGHG